MIVPHHRTMKVASVTEPIAAGRGWKVESLLPTGSSRLAILHPSVQPKGNKLGEKSDRRHAGLEAVAWIFWPGT